MATRLTPRSLEYTHESQIPHAWYDATLDLTISKAFPLCRAPVALMRSQPLLMVQEVLHIIPWALTTPSYIYKPDVCPLEAGIAQNLHQQSRFLYVRKNQYCALSSQHDIQT
jgi:hypothetical protein